MYAFRIVKFSPSSWLIMEGQAAARYLSSEYKLIIWGKGICSQQDRLGDAEAGTREKKRVHRAERWKGAHREPGPGSRCSGVSGTTPPFLVTVSGREIRDNAKQQIEGGEISTEERGPRPTCKSGQRLQPAEIIRAQSSIINKQFSCNFSSHQMVDNQYLCLIA